MRRVTLLFVLLAAALVSALPAAASLQPVRRDFGELQVPRVRSGVLQPPAGHAKGRIRVVVQLEQPPLARWSGRTLSSAGGRRKLEVASASARAYMARLARAQAAATAALRRAIPAATVSRRYQVVLNGFAVELPARDLPKLVRLGFAERVSPSVRYTLRMNESPALVHAVEYAARFGARGEGVKIAIVDDGVDPGNPFFDPSGFSYPDGFPRGGAKWTTPKVIVARAFPGPGSGRPGRLALDPDASFHGTHVAGTAAGVAGTAAPAGDDHPAVSGLSGVAPRAWIGNYRVFNVPTPVGHVANTPEIVAAFEAAVKDGMDVLNFSGGGAESEPANDALVEAVANVAAAGVVPIIAAGNDRDEFGFGTVGSPGTAPEAIAVAAASSTQVFAPVLSVTAEGAPASLAQLPFRPAVGEAAPESWELSDQTLVDVASITGMDGAPVDRLLCGPPSDPNGGRGTLPPGSLAGAIALASRGSCTFVSKAERARAAGAVGLVLVDNRHGEANTIPVRMALPGGMVADLDGARLREFLAGHGGRATVRVGSSAARIATGRGGVITSFSSAGPSAFGHALKPDVAAPGGQILSATLPRFGGPFAVFDGTSMATPHVAGAAALLLERHPWWTPAEVKSALVSTAGPAWKDTAQTVEAPVTLGGGGLVDVVRADRPLVFTRPASLSFGDLDVRGGASSRPLLTTVSDAGGGAGTWQVELRPQAATAGATLELPPAIELAAGGDAQLVAVARAAAGAAPGENYGFVVLRRDGEARRIPYFFLVTRPALAEVPAVPLRRFHEGDTSRGESRVSAYGYPAAAFGPPPSYAGPTMVQDGAETLYLARIARPVANFGVAVLAASPGAVVDPWVLGSKDENDVQGLAGTPVNVNNLTLGYRADIGAAGAALPTPGDYYVAVDSRADEFTGSSRAGRYVLQSWVDDVNPPFVLPVTTRVSAGRPTIVVRVIDGLFRPESGVDPLSLTIQYGRTLVGAAAYDPFSGIAVFPLPRQAPALRPGRHAAVVMASDYQEAKNVASVSEDVMPNTSFAATALRVVNGPTVTWLAPEPRECGAAARTPLLAVAGSTAPVREVRFFDGRQRIAVDRTSAAGLFTATWSTRGERRGRHLLRAVVVDARGRTATAERVVRVCR